jgi:integrase
MATRDRLSFLELKNAKPGKHYDGDGLCLFVKPNGSKYWRFEYRFAGRRSSVGFGTFPEVSASDARRQRDAARMLLRDGKDPAEVNRSRRLAQRQDVQAAFPAAAAAWLAHKRSEWAPESYRKAKYVTDTYLVPALGRTSVTTLNTKQAADVLTSIAAKAPTLAHKARQYLTGIVTYAIRQGLREDGRVLVLRGALPKHAKGNIPAATDPREITALLKAIDAYPSRVLRASLTLAMLTAMRPGTVAAARWADIDLDAAEWSVPAELMKIRRAHIVPLPTQAITALRDMLQFTAGGEYVFPPLARQQSAHLSRDALSNALRRMGFRGKHATHGFRGMFRTVARERLGVDPDILEAQLAHAKRGDVQKAYDRTTFNEERRRVMQAWADYLDVLQAGGKVVSIAAQRRTAAGK